MTRIAAPVGRTSLTDIRTTVVAPPPEFPTVFRDPRANPSLATPVAWMPPPSATRHRVARGAVVAASLAGLSALAFVGNVDSPLIESPRVETVAARSEPVATPAVIPAPAPVAAPVQQVAEPRILQRPSLPPPKVASAPAPQSERQRQRVAPTPPAAPANDRALALLQSAPPMRTPSAPYDAAAAQRATARLAAQAARVPPSVPHAMHAPVVAIEVPPSPPAALVSAPAAVVEPRADPRREGGARRPRDHSGAGTPEARGCKDRTAQAREARSLPRPRRLGARDARPQAAASGTGRGTR
jgi:hypothetical protein